VHVLESRRHGSHIFCLYRFSHENFAAGGSTAQAVHPWLFCAQSTVVALSLRSGIMRQHKTAVTVSILLVFLQSGIADALAWRLFAGR
jgi:hypothetical protein